VTWYRSLWYKTLDRGANFGVVAKVVYGPEGFQLRFVVTSSQHGGFLPVSSTLSITVPGRDGEPLQAATRTVQRSHLHPYLPGESVVVVFLHRLCADECSAAELSSYDRASFCTSGTIRTKLLKLGARVLISVRRIQIAISTGCLPYCSIGNCKLLAQ